MSGSNQLLQALIYRDANGTDTDITCSGCAEDLKKLIKHSPSHHINVSFVGPNDTPLDTPGLFDGVALFAIPGGPDLGRAWDELSEHSDTIRNFVMNGGRYLGVCLGAFLAGPDDGFDLMSEGNYISREVLQPNNPVGYQNTSDAVANVDWNYQTGVNQSHSYEQYAFFQDGPTFWLPNMTNTKVLGTYVSNGNISATLNSFGLGWVGLVGVHVDADETWYQYPNTPVTFSNPSGIQFDIGWDLINATLNGANPDSTFVENVPYTNLTESSSAAETTTASKNSTSAGTESYSVNLLLVLFLGVFWMRVFRL